MSDKDDDQSIQDIVREAAATEESAAINANTSTDTDSTESTETVSTRDENGKFKSKTKADEPVTDTTTGAAEQDQGTWSPERAPSSWTPKAREGWANLPIEIRQEITRREENATMGARKLQEQYAPVKQFVENFDPIFRELGSIGVDPQRHVASVMNTERVLRTAELPQKFDALLGIADQYGIPLRDIINQSVGQKVLQTPSQMQVPEEIRRELGEIRQWRDQQEQAIVNNEVSNFGQQQEFFNDVRYAMADLIERGVCQDLNQAYEIATWAHPEIRSVLIDRQVRGSSVGQVVNRQSKAVGASVKPSNTVNVDLDDDSNDSIGDTLRKAFTASTGRL